MNSKKGIFNKNLFLLWQGQLISQIGNQAFLVGMNFWIKHNTNSASLVGLLMMISNIPVAILGPIAGAFVDNNSKKKIIVFSDLINGLAIFLLCFIMLLIDKIPIIIIILFLISIFVSTVNAFFLPAITASIPEIVDKKNITSANAINEGITQFSIVLGQSISGILYQYLGAFYLFLTNGVSYILSSLSETFINIPESTKISKNNEISNKFKFYLNETIEGFKFIYKNKGMRNLFIIVSVLNFFIMPFITLMPFYVENFLNTTAIWYGYIMSAFSLGSLIGFLLASLLKIKNTLKGNLVRIFIVLNTLGITGLAFINNKIYAFSLMLLCGILNGFINVNIITILQIKTPTLLRGRIFGNLNTLTMGIAPISMGISGIVADLLNKNIPLIYIICGSIATILSMIIIIDRETKKFLIIS